MNRKAFVYIWEYLVNDEHISDFIRIYGPDGDWVQLFKQSDGYIGTDLHQDISDPNRFITVDYWKTKRDRDSFQNQFRVAFNALDKQAANYTETENLLGEFDSNIHLIDGS